MAENEWMLHECMIGSCAVVQRRDGHPHTLIWDFSPEYYVKWKKEGGEQ